MYEDIDWILSHLVQNAVEVNPGEESCGRKGTSNSRAMSWRITFTLTHFSKGPPAQGAIVTIQTVHFLSFISTSFSAVTFTTACVNAGKPTQCASQYLLKYKTPTAMTLSYQTPRSFATER
ncbi:hypothetical protein M422DRAFT_250334 [Sphaerobolus stellatus SS14]|uniref:Uncharacterized protein n=1 Tax=Sphaerobolus stellatus (strain SS14) TaxID=990650 RepID=A0A0C9VGX2_SPHS4|nr:hypothetical protein M422DRAFT_250334 [Sphaerobolus stellatus SS14]